MRIPQLYIRYNDVCNLCRTGLLVILVPFLYNACGGRTGSIADRRAQGVEDISGIPSHAEAPAQNIIPTAIIIEQELTGQIYGKRLTAPGAIRQVAPGVLVVIDAGNHRIVKLDSSLIATADFGGANSSGGRLLAPSRIAADGRGNFFLSDAELREILQFDDGLNLLKEIAFSDNDDALKFGEPAGLAVDNDGMLWVSDSKRSRIAVFDRFGDFREFYADFNSGGSHLERPGAMAPLSEGGAVLCDEGEGQALIFDSYGIQRGVIGKGILRSPVDVSVASDGRIWVCDSALAEVLCFQANGELLFRTGSLGTAYNIALTAPTAICVRENNTLLISDTGADRILLCRVISAG